MNADLLILRMASKRRNALNERDGAGLRLWRSAQLRRSSDSVAAPSQQRCAHHERSTGQGSPSKIIEQPLGKICQKQGDTISSDKPLFFRINLPKELRSLP